MKKLVVALIAMCGLLSGCVVHPAHYDDSRGYRGDRHGEHRGMHRGDRDHDGIPNRWDRRPNNPYRY